MRRDDAAVDRQIENAPRELVNKTALQNVRLELFKYGLAQGLETVGRNDGGRRHDRENASHPGIREDDR